MLAFALTGCERSYERKTYEKPLDIAVETDPVSAGALEEELSEIADKYDKGGTLTEIFVTFKGQKEIETQKGTISYTFTREDQKEKKGITVILTYDMKQKKVTKVNYDKGYGTFEESFTKPVVQEKGALFSSLLEHVKNSSDFKSKISSKNAELTIEYTSENIHIEVK